MQTTIPSKPSLWQALKDLDFLSAFFSWFFMLLTRLSEPLMLLATLYVVAETGVPVIAQPALHNLSVGIMITAPEIILPGAFVVASRAKEHSRWLYTVCWTFIVLTFITLISLFVWHFTGEALAYLMCARCATAVGYSILMRVMNHSKKADHLQTVPVPNVQTEFATLSEQVKEMWSVQSGKLDEIHTSFSARTAHLEKTIEHQIAVNRTPKPADAVPVSEQFGDFASVNYRTPLTYSETLGFELREYGTLPVQNGETNVSEQSEEQDIEHSEPAQEQRLRIVRTAKKPVRKVKKERGNALELVTDVLQAKPNATLSEIVSQTGISRGHASTLRTQILNKRDFA